MARQLGPEYSSERALLCSAWPGSWHFTRSREYPIGCVSTDVSPRPSPRHKQVPIGWDWSGYWVAPGVRTHRAVGVGVYSYFRDHAVRVRAGIVAPPHLVSSFEMPFSRFLNGMPGSGILFVLNSLGKMNRALGMTATLNTGTMHVAYS